MMGRVCLERRGAHLRRGSRVSSAAAALRFAAAACLLRAGEPFFCRTTAARTTRTHSFAVDCGTAWVDQLLGEERQLGWRRSRSGAFALHSYIGSADVPALDKASLLRVVASSAVAAGLAASSRAAAPTSLVNSSASANVDNAQREQAAPSFLILGAGATMDGLLPHLADLNVASTQVLALHGSMAAAASFQLRHPAVPSVVVAELQYFNLSQVAGPDSVVGCVILPSSEVSLAMLANVADSVAEDGAVVLLAPSGGSQIAFADLLSMLEFLPLELHMESMSGTSYAPWMAVLKKTPFRALPQVLYLRGSVAHGFGRGSKRLGVPTANLPSSQFASHLQGLQTGVYFGWALVEGRDAWGKPGKMVANIGYSPTFAGAENAEKIVEAHLIGYTCGEDFYGAQLRLLIVGFQRKERRFNSFIELVAAIHKDVADADAALERQPFRAFRDDVFFARNVGEGCWQAVARNDALALITAEPPLP